MAKVLTKGNSLLIPLYLGITGHRDIRDEDRMQLKLMIKEFIEKKQRQCPHTPIVFLTPLAEGADRLAALAAIECKIDFIAVLPLPAEEYKKDFVLPGSVGEFEDLIKKASAIIEIPLYNCANIEDIRQKHESRTEQYYRNGLFIARQCHTLVALWDGTDSGKKGGTSEVVKLMRSGIPVNSEDASKKLSNLQTGTVYHIIAPRKSTPIPRDPFTVKVYYPSYYGDDFAKAEKNDDQMLGQIDTFNRDVEMYAPDLSDEIRKSIGYLANNYSDLDNQPQLQNISEMHGVAGSMATFFQKKRFLALKVLLSLVVIAFLFLQIYAEFYKKPVILLLYPVTMGAGALWFFMAKRKQYEHKHEDYRALAEAYRVQFFLKACGIKHYVSDHYLSRHRGELEWVLYALRTSDLDDFKVYNTTSVPGMKVQLKPFDFIKTSWVDDQLKYFVKTANKQNHLLEKWESRANISFISAIISACLLFLLSLNAERFPENLKHFEEILHAVLFCCTHVFLVVAAALHGYTEKMVFAEQAKNYQQMVQLFQLAKTKLNNAISANDATEAEDIIWELAQEALLENGDWLLLHRSRPLEMPKG